MYKVLPRILAVMFFSILLAGVFTIRAKADVITPDFLSAQCKIDETEVDCNYTTAKPFGTHLNDTCIQYAQNSNYYLLSSRSGSAGGSSRYCQKSGQNPSPVNTQLLTTVVWGMVVFIAVCLLAVFGVVILILVRWSHKKKEQTHATA